VLLAKFIRDGELMNVEAMTLAGKLNRYSNLVEGKFECCLIIHLVKDKAGKKEVGRQESKLCGGCLNFGHWSWKDLSFRTWMSIFREELWYFNQMLWVGATSDKRKGWGCCNPGKMEYARGSWPGYILGNTLKFGQT
jgi:hypothetical protein